ncbi:MAG: hypothetical protein OEW09_14180, partial [Anaerolineae bacterium]|nr:hypothetical protein [Anaerolineae bacterium]
MNLVALDQLLNRTPVVVKGMHPVSLGYLDDPVTVYASLQELVWLLDTPQQTPPHRALSLDVNVRFSSRFPVVIVEHDPFTPELNRFLLDRYDFVAASMLTQAQVAERIVAEARRAETVVLVLLDGLSYADCRDWPGVEPCLATAPTITRIGFPAIIGSPPLAARLFATGLTRRIGFTYWERQDEPLTNRLFRTITDTRRLDPNRSGAFSQVVDWLSAHDLTGTYIQIVRSALDDYAEGHRAIVPRRAVVQQARRDLETVLDILEHKGRSAVLFAVADHGILWKEDSHEIEFVDLNGGRYAEGRGGAGRGKLFEVDGQPYWVLDYPQMGRSWRSNEQ